MTAGQEATPVSYAPFGEAAQAFQRSRRSAADVPETVQGLRKAIDAADLWVLHEIDPQMLLRRGGYLLHAARQLLFFHPRHMARLLAADPAALLEAPLKLAVLAVPDGSVVVRWIDPAAAFARYDNPLLDELGRELADACEDIVEAALASQTGSS